jgi:capsular exopolysaccharide synthesis family protein
MMHGHAQANPMYLPQQQPGDGMVSDIGATPPILVQYLNVLARWKWVVAAIMAATIVIAVIITLITTPQYTATSRIEIDRQQQNVTNVQGVEPPREMQDDEFYQTQYSLLAARSLAGRVVRQLRLATDEEFFAAHSVDVSSNGIFGGNTSNTLTAQERAERERLAVDLLLKHITIDPIIRSKLVDVRYTSASPSYSAKIADTWVRQFIQGNLDRRYASTADAREFLEGRLAELGNRLEQSERAAVRYAAERDIINLGASENAEGRRQPGRTLTVTDLEALNGALATATAQRIEAQSRLSQPGSLAQEALNNETLTALRQRRAEARGEHARLSAQFEPEYPAVKALSSQIAALERSIEQEEVRIEASRNVGYQEAVARERRLHAEVNELRSELLRENNDSIQYNILTREADTNRQLYDSLLQRYKEIGVASIAANNIAVVDTARVPESPSSPNLFLNLAIGFVAGIALSFVTLVALEQIDEGLRDIQSVPKRLGLPALGGIRRMEDADLRDSLSDSKSELSEAFLSIQSNLAFATDHGFPRSLMLTSTRPSEGKSTSSATLATVLGRAGKRVLLVDGDMRSPSAHGFFGLRHDIGLSNYLSGDDDWNRMVQDTGLKGLDMLSAGPTPPSAAELLNSDRFSRLIGEAKEKYDHVIVDSPPILGLADAPLITRAVEGCVFVVEAGGVSVRGLQSALARLGHAQANIFGVILTKLDVRQGGYGYGYGYGYDYGKANEKA